VPSCLEAYPPRTSKKKSEFQGSVPVLLSFCPSCPCPPVNSNCLAAMHPGTIRWTG
jgi:hypothetical protein